MSDVIDPQREAEARAQIHTHPDPILRTPGQEVADPTSDGIVDLVTDMIEVMRATRGVGLAAPQVGHSLRVIVVEQGADLVPRALINPEITWRGETMVQDIEGCLSLPGIGVPVSRHQTIRVRAQQVTGDVCEFECQGLLARIIQHEVDHLDGILILDRTAPEIRREILLGPT